MTRIVTMTETLTPSRLWKQMNSAQRLASARAFWSDDEAVDDQIQAALLIAQQKKFRPKTVMVLLLAIVMVALYMVWHVVLHGFGLADRPVYSVGLALLALAFMLGLYVVQVCLVLDVQSRWIEVLRRHAYDGFDLDEWATRLTFRIWPAALPATARMEPAAAIRIEPMGKEKA